MHHHFRLLNIYKTSHLITEGLHQNVILGTSSILYQVVQRHPSEYVTGFGINGLIAGLVKIDFFQNRHLLSSSTAYAKYESFT